MSADAAGKASAVEMRLESGGDVAGGLAPGNGCGFGTVPRLAHAATREVATSAEAKLVARVVMLTTVYRRNSNVA
jgi:hypothetical protein